MSKTKLHLLTEVGCLLCDTLYDSKRADAGFTTCFECGVMLAKFARTERARFYDLNPDRKSYRFYNYLWRVEHEKHNQTKPNTKPRSRRSVQATR
jgi:hypothetical protein